MDKTRIHGIFILGKRRRPAPAQRPRLIRAPLSCFFFSLPQKSLILSILYNPVIPSSSYQPDQIFRRKQTSLLMVFKERFDVVRDAVKIQFRDSP